VKRSCRRLGRIPVHKPQKKRVVNGRLIVRQPPNVNRMGVASYSSLVGFSEVEERKSCIELSRTNCYR
jgi:hypothetical protein